MDWPADPALGEVVRRVAADGRLPRLRLVERRTTPTRLTDVAGTTRTEVGRLVGGRIPGPIAVGVGSRGIANLVLIVGSVIAELRARGFDPFIVPAMGSHGGGTVSGQLEVLASYGITEGALGVEIRASVDTVVVGEVAGVPVHLDRNVAEVGSALLVCRIKPHTDFQGPIESGAAKMAAVGLGKQAGAARIHALGIPGLRDVMPAIGRFLAERYLLGAVAVVENELDQTSLVHGLRAEEIGREPETELLAQARASLPRLPTSDLDVLVIDRMGKDISGTGIDPNVTGRWLMAGLPEPEQPNIRCIVALGLTEASHGNAIGVGLADFGPARLLAQIDLSAFYLNVMTSGWAGLRRGRLPVILPTDRDAVLAAVATSGRPLDQVRVAWISDTLHTQICAVSEAVWSQPAADRSEVRAVGAPFALPFDATGRLRELADYAASEIHAGRQS